MGPEEPSDDTPSVTPVGRDSSLREGAGERSHSTGYSLKSDVSGDFHRPYESVPFNRTLRYRNVAAFLGMGGGGV